MNLALHLIFTVFLCRRCIPAYDSAMRRTGRPDPTTFSQRPLGEPAPKPAHEIREDPKPQPPPQINRSFHLCPPHCSSHHHRSLVRDRIHGVPRSAQGLLDWSESESSAHETNMLPEDRTDSPTFGPSPGEADGPGQSSSPAQGPGTDDSLSTDSEPPPQPKGRKVGISSNAVAYAISTGSCAGLITRLLGDIRSLPPRKRRKKAAELLAKCETMQAETDAC